MTSHSVTIADPAVTSSNAHPVVDRLCIILRGTTDIGVTDIPDGGTTLTVGCAAELAEAIACDGEVRALILAGVSPHAGSGLGIAHYLLRIADLR